MIAQQDALQALRSHLPELMSRYPIISMALFGSVTRSDFDPAQSDIDIMIEAGDTMGWEFFDLAHDLEEILGRKVDLVSKRAIKPHYWESIKDDLIDV